MYFSQFSPGLREGLEKTMWEVLDGITVSLANCILEKKRERPTANREDDLTRIYS